MLKPGKRTNNFSMAFIMCFILVFIVMSSAMASALTCQSTESKIIVTKSAGGTATVSGEKFTPQCVTKGEAITLTVAPTAGYYQIKSVKIGGVAQTISDPNAATDLSVTASTTKKTTIVKITFALRTYTISVSSTDTDISISPRGASLKKKYNQKVPFTLTVKKSSSKTPELLIDGTAVDLNQVNNTKKYKYTLTVTGDHVVEAREGSSVSAAVAKAFPTSFALSSPLKKVKKSSSKVSRYEGEGPAENTDSGEVASAEEEIQSINTILASGDIEACAFDPNLFQLTPQNPQCYGPTLVFQNHPDAPNGTNANGELPPFDLGIWKPDETFMGPDNTELTTSCSAAKLNSLVDGTSAKVNGSLRVLASMLCVAKVNAIALPDTGDSVDLTTEMNALIQTIGMQNVSFDSATISHSTASGSEEFNYAVDLNLTFGDKINDLIVNLTHRPDDSEDIYKGRLNYKFVDSASDNPKCSSGTPSASSAVTNAGSVLYDKQSAIVMLVDARSADYCGSDVDPFAASGDLKGMIDPSVEKITTPDGWTGNYNYFVANADPIARTGDYAFAWQAGSGDPNTRVFNINITRDQDTGKISGAAFFGYGDSAAASDGSIKGFICNWAGPGNTHNYQKLVQAQYISQDDNGLFSSSADNTFITYAPTNSCNYDGTGTFVYDKDIDGSLTDESATAAVNNNLKALADSDGDSIYDIFKEKGFTLPLSPDNF